MSQTNSAAPAAAQAAPAATAQEAHELLREVVQRRQQRRRLHLGQFAGAQGREDRGGLLAAQAPSLHHLSQPLVGVWDPGMMDMIAEAMVQLGR